MLYNELRLSLDLINEYMLSFLWLVYTYIENIFRLQSGSIGQLVGSSMLMAVVDHLIDVSTVA